MKKKEGEEKEKQSWKCVDLYCNQTLTDQSELVM